MEKLTRKEKTTKKARSRQKFRIVRRGGKLVPMSGSYNDLIADPKNLSVSEIEFSSYHVAKDTADRIEDFNKRK